MSANRRIAALVLLLLVVAQLSTGHPPSVYARSTESLKPAGPEYGKLAIKAQKEGVVRVIVGLNVPFTLEGKLMSARAAQAQRDVIHSTQDMPQASLNRYNATALPNGISFLTWPWK